MPDARIPFHHSFPGCEVNVGSYPKRRHFSSTLLLVLFLSGGGCSDDPAGPKELEPLVGVWEASELVMTNQANPSVVVNLIEQGATFFLSVLANGQYSASLTFLGQATSEMGTIQVSGNNVTITPTQPEGPPLVATWSFVGENLVLDGESAFDFNLDGTPEASFAHIVLEPAED